MSTANARVSAPFVYQRKDAFYTRAKSAGYRSRAAFKLLELARRYRLFHRGDRIIDLGAWPGGTASASRSLPVRAGLAGICGAQG